MAGLTCRGAQQGQVLQAQGQNHKDAMLTLGLFLKGQRLLSHPDSLQIHHLAACWFTSPGFTLNVDVSSVPEERQSAHQYHLFIILLCVNTEDNKSDPSAHLKKKHIARFLLEPASAAYQDIKYSILSYYKSVNAV